MFITEGEAKTKWCPQTRVIDYTGGDASPSGNRSTMSQPSEALNGAAMCIGSACMAWRWAHLGFDHNGMPLSEPVQPDGYCGLAGMP